MLKRHLIFLFDLIFLFFLNYQSSRNALAKVSISILTKTLTFTEFDLLSFLNNKRKGKLQITPLKFRVDWILHLNVSET